ncbi:Sec-independent protein translocase subunit TatA [Saccharothrix deserti]|uniref:Sec-independent protein translocase subunit TatA n=1 Tax=Saccharothrix deserti TaxID=2593674 RepID=UPI00131C3C4A|nr:Sec-independent protein translocase subunit TatA [Saccharothrix deserti]
MGNLGATELIIIAVVIILLFGAKKLPDMARSLGRSAKILKAETKGLRDEDDQSQANQQGTTAQQVQAPQQLPPAQPQVAQPQVVQQPVAQPQPAQPQVAPPIEQSGQNLQNKQNSN